MKLKCTKCDERLVYEELVEIKTDFYLDQDGSIVKMGVRSEYLCDDRGVLCPNCDQGYSNEELLEMSSRITSDKFSDKLKNMTLKEIFENRKLEQEEINDFIRLLLNKELK